MAVLYVTEEGSMLRRTGDRIVVSVNRETRLDVPMRQVEQVVLFGGASVTGPTVAGLLEQGIALSYLTQSGKYLGRLEPPVSKNAPLRRAQYRAATDPAACAAIARAIILGKLANGRTFLMRIRRAHPETELDEPIDAIRRLEDSILDGLDVDQLRGVEGAGGAAYFGAFGRLVRAEGFAFSGRVRRPPTDPVNALLGFGYTLLANELVSAIAIAGLDPYIGFLHDDRQGRPSLALDLVEEFRTLIVDSLVLMLINKRVLRPEDFECEVGGAARMTTAARRTFIEQWEARLNDEVKHPVAGYRVTYRRACEVQARLLGRHLMGELPAYVPLVTK